MNSKRSSQEKDNNMTPQRTSNVESRATRTTIKRWIKLFFGGKVIAMSSHQLLEKRSKMKPIIGHYNCMIITL